jgi:transmembrane sensor
VCGILRSSRSALISFPSMPAPQNNRRVDQGTEKAALRWIVRRDRGLSPAEQDEYLQWLACDTSHGEALARQEASFDRLLRLGRQHPARSNAADRDLFAPPRRGWRFRRMSGLFAAAAALVIGTVWLGREPASPTLAPQSYVRLNESRTLSDGSTVELKDGSRIEVTFTAERREVRLIGGAAHFTIAKDPARDFTVQASDVTVRALGTVFSVRLDAAAVEVLVTEGTVTVEPPSTGAARGERSSAVLPVLSAGRRVLVPLEEQPTEPLVTTMSSGEMKQALAWQGPRFKFFETPLQVAIAQFNQRNRMQLVLGNPDLGTIPIGGTFRVDNVEGFLRLLEMSLEIRSEPRSDDTIVLLKSR